MGRKRVPVEIQKEKTRIRNARNYAKTKAAREFYDMCKNNLNDKGHKKVENNKTSNSPPEEGK